MYDQVVYRCVHNPLQPPSCVCMTRLYTGVYITHYNHHPVCMTRLYTGVYITHYNHHPVCVWCILPRKCEEPNDNSSEHVHREVSTLHQTRTMNSLRRFFIMSSFHSSSLFCRTASALFRQLCGCDTTLNGNSVLHSHCSELPSCLQSVALITFSLKCSSSKTTRVSERTQRL